MPDADRRRAMDERLGELGAAEGLDFRFDLIPKRPNTNAAHRVIRWAGPDGAAVGEAIMRAHFTQGRDIGDHGTESASGNFVKDGAGTLTISFEGTDGKKIERSRERWRRIQRRRRRVSDLIAGAPTPDTE